MCSGVASRKIGGKKFFYFKLATAFCLEYRLSKHILTRYFKNLGGYAYNHVHINQNEMSSL